MTTSKKIVILLGPSGCGKDYVAQTTFHLHKGLKLNAFFKAIFEKDHGLNPGTCNNKAYRKEVLAKGPCQGMTIQDAMVQCYVESLHPSISSYGAGFAGKTLHYAMSRLLREDGPWVVTDLRKPSEALVIAEFAVNQLGLELQSFNIVSNYGQELGSDRSLREVMNILSKYGPLNTITNYH
jgi:hypothetical protein